MFGFIRRRVERKIADILKGNLSAFTNFNGTPRFFWDDPFVIGYHYQQTRLIYHSMAGKSFTEKDFSLIFMNTLALVSGLQADHLGRIAMDYFLDENEDFKVGQHNGDIVARFILGHVIDSEIEEEFTISAQRIFGNASRENVGALLQSSFLYEPLKARFKA